MAHQYREIPAAQVPQHVLDGRWDTPAASQEDRCGSLRVFRECLCTRCAYSSIVTHSLSSCRVIVSYAADGRYEAGPGAKYRRTHDASLAGGHHGRQYRYEVDLVESAS